MKRLKLMSLLFIVGAWIWAVCSCGSLSLFSISKLHWRMLNLLSSPSLSTKGFGWTVISGSTNIQIDLTSEVVWPALFFDLMEYFVMYLSKSNKRSLPEVWWCVNSNDSILNLFWRELARGLRYFKMVIFCVLIALMVHKHLLGVYLSNFSASFFILTFWRKLMIFLLADFSVSFFWKLFLLVALIFVLFLFLADFLGLYLNFWQINFKLSGKCFTVYFFLISVVPRPIWCTWFGCWSILSTYVWQMAHIVGRVRCLMMEGIYLTLWAKYEEKKSISFFLKVVTFTCQMAFQFDAFKLTGFKRRNSFPSSIGQLYNLACYICNCCWISFLFLFNFFSNFLFSSSSVLGKL